MYIGKNNMRAFIALDPPSDFKLTLEPVILGLSRDLSQNFKPTVTNQLHVTLAFFANLTPEEVDIASTIVQAMKVKTTVPLKVVQLTAVPGSTRANSIVLSLFPSAPLLQLYDQLQNGLLKNQLPVDRKRFKPHLTLGCLRQPKDVKFLLRPTLVPKKAFPADTVTLYQSTLTPTGSVYTPISSQNILRSVFSSPRFARRSFSEGESRGTRRL